MYLTLFWTFFKIGLFTFGGGYAMIPFIHRFGVDKYQWITEDEFLNIITIAESTPGPIAINSATYIGHKVKGIRGSIAATIGVALPSVIIIILIAAFFMQFKENPHVEYAFKGVRIGVSVLVLNAAIRMYKKLDKHWISYFLIGVGFIILLFHFFSVIYVIMIGGAVGIIYQLLTVRGDTNGNLS
ncbi:chromate transporter [Hujiaoplasma nucleasis]|uniref:Chromate transporter n=1 Tax=Hujiaoplasma nucleasis TaxID=2725268 RepID=A0A7L6N578_9MOLU|nr:chromate transporter [Hujiaoplasma nucleasis]QLY39654.1 chromate transporter [Hujiaoplasma nucleasis]